MYLCKYAVVLATRTIKLSYHSTHHTTQTLLLLPLDSKVNGAENAYLYVTENMVVAADAKKVTNNFSPFSTHIHPFVNKVI